MERLSWALCIMGCVTLAAKGGSGYALILKEDGGYSGKPWSTMKIVQSSGHCYDWLGGLRKHLTYRTSVFHMFKGSWDEATSPLISTCGSHRG